MFFFFFNVKVTCWLHRVLIHFGAIKIAFKKPTLTSEGGVSFIVLLEMPRIVSCLANEQPRSRVFILPLPCSENAKEGKKRRDTLRPRLRNE